MHTYAITTATYQRRALLMRSANAELLMKTLTCKSGRAADGAFALSSQ
jgi:hypothetical protein